MHRNQRVAAHPNRQSRMHTGFPFAAVAFDLDGTTLNTEDLYKVVCDELLARRGHIYDRETRMAMIGRPAAAAYAVLKERKGLPETAEQLHDECVEIFDGILDDRVAPMPGIVQLLDWLDLGRTPRCIATSSQRPFALRALAGAGLLERFDFIITADDVPHGKPAPDIYLAVAERYEIAIDRLLVLEDSSAGVAAGVAAGAYTIAVANHHTAGSNYDGASFICESVIEAIGHLEAL